MLPLPAIQPVSTGTSPTVSFWLRSRWGAKRAVLSSLMLSGLLGLYWLDAQRGSASSFSSWTSGSTTSRVPPGITPSPLLQWGQELSASTLTAKLSPVAAQQLPTEAVSSPTFATDRVYHLGPATWPEYIARLNEFVEVVLPPPLARAYRASQLASGGQYSPGWDGRKIIWQTDKDDGIVGDQKVLSWKEGAASKEGWDWTLLTDRDCSGTNRGSSLRTASTWVRERLAGTRLELIWDNLPSGILRADLLRYLLLAFEGGLYADTDTILLKGPSAWGRGARLWRGGEGWMSEADIQRVELSPDKDAELNLLLGRPKLIVGIEADVGSREDWADWWPRPLQIVQWTVASSPFHPVALDTLLRILHNTADAITFAQSHYAQFLAALDPELDIPFDELARLARLDVLSEPRDGGPFGVINWTGPAVWTDAVLGYLRARYGMEWTELRGLTEPMRVGDVVILPVTGFSPGVRNFNAGEVTDPQAMVEHAFRGSWKSQDGRK